MNILGNGKNRGEFGDLSQGSFRQRSMSHDRMRRREVHRQIIFICSAAIVAISIILLACRIITGKNNKNSSPETLRVEQQKTASAKAVPKATSTPKRSGSKRWLRKNLNSKKPMVALTFDDGPYTPVTSKILDTLEKYDAKATFFCVGSRVPQYSEVVKRAYNQGCEIASHTYNHRYLSGLSPKKIKREQKLTNKAVKKAIGCKPTALRPPGGFVNKKVRRNMMVPMICWSVDTEDWKSRNANKVLKKSKHIEDGDVVLMHDLYPTTADAVEKLVPKLIKKGYQLVTVDELFYYKNIPLKAGELHFSGK